MLVLCLVLASSVLSASFVMFVVREQENNSKHPQLVSGAPAAAYWAANYGWDLLSYSLSSAGLLALIVWYWLPQFVQRPAPGGGCGVAVGVRSGRHQSDLLAALPVSG
ncbi:hypothetical protein Vretimale_13200 [Volvox reticuliferus]|uniref:ABC-2 type transporter transmembrane domain-containing protein n=1 Tax=Volvox reticuliferus TaxID=1737510 RepID=A0A8J4CPA6_9CHLO|nr:hypothetical protein Vretifemale_14244 [Volvox reticuliferus]GIM09289.1 hypothetical protein Vretimale_13200 [Volvox reticuliferus]